MAGQDGFRFRQEKRTKGRRNCKCDSERSGQADDISESEWREQTAFNTAQGEERKKHDRQQ